MPVKIKSTLGSVTLAAENVSGDTTLTVPSGTATLQTTTGSGAGLIGLTSSQVDSGQTTAKAWANVGLDNVAAGNTTPDGSHNISSVTLVSAGNARFNFTNSISTGNVSSQASTNYFYIKINGTTTTYVDVTAYASNQVAASASLVNVVVFGG